MKDSVPGPDFLGSLFDEMARRQRPDVCPRCGTSLRAGRSRADQQGREHHEGEQALARTHIVHAGGDARESNAAEQKWNDATSAGEVRTSIVSNRLGAVLKARS